MVIAPIGHSWHVDWPGPEVNSPGLERQSVAVVAPGSDEYWPFGAS